VELAGKKCDEAHPCAGDYRCESGACVACTDGDGDHIKSIACGGGDCDDANANVRPGVPEQCANGVDDNCDGKTDSEDAACACTAGTTQSCTGEGVCPGSRRVCESGVFSECRPPAETCDGADNDCDGATDEVPGGACVFAAQQDCTTACSTAGKRTCDSTCHFGACVGKELCNAIDDDCDGSTDEDFECITGRTTTCTTACSSVGTTVCGGACTGGTCAPPAEECNGKDDDCVDGADNGFACVKGAPSGESCATACATTGTKVCNDTCAASDKCLPPPEMCNQLNDDCVGGVDDGLSGGARKLHGNTAAQLAYESAVAAADGFVGYAFAANGELFAGASPLSALGNPLTAPRAQLTARTDADAREPDLAMGALNVGAVWRDATSTGCAPAAPPCQQIRFAIISRVDGTVKLVERALGRAKSSARPRVAWSDDGGGRFAVTWLDHDDTVFNAVYSEPGVELAAPHDLLAGAHADGTTVAIASHPGGGGFSIVVPVPSLTDGSLRAHLRRITADGVLTGSDSELTSAVAGSFVGTEPVELASVSGRYTAAWMVREPNNTRAVVEMSWDAAGTPPLGGAQRLSPAGGPVSGDVQLAVQPDGFAVSWTEVQTVSQLKVAAVAGVNSARFHRLDETNGAEYTPSVPLGAAPAFDGASYWFTWTDNGLVLLRRLCP
jgi:hypothetical protein